VARGTLPELERGRADCDAAVCAFTITKEEERFLRPGRKRAVQKAIGAALLERQEPGAISIGYKIDLGAGEHLLVSDLGGLHRQFSTRTAR